MSKRADPFAIELTPELIIRACGGHLPDGRDSETAGVLIRIPLRVAVMDACPGISPVRVRKPWWRW